jgi:type VI secretion system protein ImpK
LADDRQSGFDPDATQFIPSPGGRRSDVSLAAVAATQPFAPFGVAVDFETLDGLNPLVAAANPILVSVPRIRSMVNHPDPAKLRELLLERIARFEQSARNRGVPADDIMIARYALCTLVDDAVAATPWGGTAQWANRSLLVTLHQETWGGEKFFQILNKLAEMPAAKVNLLELFYVCLALGFEGRFRILDNGKSQLEQLRQKVAAIIRSVRGEHERDLSSSWRGEQTQVGQTHSLFTLWASAAVVAALLLVAFAVASFSLNGISDTIEFGKVYAIAPKPLVEPRPVAVAPRLSKFLQPEIRDKLVEVRDEAGRSVVSILGDGLFDSGSSVIRSGYEPVVLRIADALNEVPGLVLVTGHTDNMPSRSIRFPSNWHLSRERAQNVQNLLGSRVTNPARLHYEGRGDTQPIVPNDSEANRARNRRVEIILQVAG